MSAQAIVRTLYDKVANGDLSAVVDMLAEDVIFIQAPSLPFGGEWRGPAGFLEMAMHIAAAWPGFSAEPRSFFGNERDQVAVRVFLTGESLAMEMIELWSVADGKITKCQPFYFDAAAAARSAKEI